MAQPFVGEIRPVPYNFAPRNWQLCQGQLLAISQNDALFALYGTTYGGDGISTFALPDLRGRVPVGQGLGYVMGQRGGAESVSLTISQIPIHSHAALSTDNAGVKTAPSGQLWATDGSGATAEYDLPPNATMHAAAIGNTGGGQPHENRQPFLTINFIVALFGIFPSRN
jgi:microcystin-dependent protein